MAVSRTPHPPPTAVLLPPKGKALIPSEVVSIKHPRVTAFLAAVAVAICVLALPILCLYIEYNTQYTTHGEVTPAVSYRITGGLTLTDGDGEPLLPPDRTARAATVLIPAWVRLAAAMMDQLLAVGVALWDEYGI